MKKLGILLGLVLIAVPVVAFACAWYHKIDICHATASETNPYNLINVDLDSIIKNHGHDDHAGDIIPSFWWRDTDNWMTFENPGVNPHYMLYSGKNWNAVGQAIYRNGCNIPATPTPTNTPVTPTPTNTPVTPTPTNTPITPTATPITPTATPITPTATPETSTTTPVTPTATPVTPTVTPETPTATLVSPTPTREFTPTPTSVVEPTPTLTPEPPKQCKPIGYIWYQCNTGNWTYTGTSGPKCWCGGLNGTRVVKESYDCGQHWTYYLNGKITYQNFSWLGFYPAPICAIGGGGGECFAK